MKQLQLSGLNKLRLSPFSFVFFIFLVFRFSFDDEKEGKGCDSQGGVGERELSERVLSAHVPISVVKCPTTGLK